MSMIEFHRQIMGDRVRNTAFLRALKHSIVKGETVLADLGSGTGFLAFLARKLGAKECILFEHSDILHVSTEIAKRSGISRCQFIHAHSMNIARPPKVDVVVSETLGNFALEEHILETLEDGKRFLKKGGVIIPRRIRQFVCPIVSPRFLRELLIWDRIGLGVDFSPAKEISLSNMYVRRFRPKDLLGKGKASKLWDEIAFTKGERSSSIRNGTVTWRMEKPRRILGFALFWEAELAEGVSLSTSPMAPKTHWEQIFLPVAQPLHLEHGESIHLSITSDSRPHVTMHVRWRVLVRDRAGRTKYTCTMDTLKGLLT